MAAADARRGRAGPLLRAALAAALAWALPGLAPRSACAQSSDALTVTLTPRDMWPPSPVTDLTGLPGAEGQMLLQWTAPDSNAYVFPGNPTASSVYFIRVATFSIASVGGSTTTWWGLATSVQALPAPAIAVTPPTPGLPGTAESLLLSQLEPGVTHYAMIVSRDAAGQESDGDALATSGAQDHTLVFDANPPVPQGLSVAQTGRSTFTVTFSTVNAYDLDFYRLYVDSTAPYDFADAWTVLRDSAPPTQPVSFQLVSLPTATYHFRLASVDKGAPGYGGAALESAYATAIADLVPSVRRAQEPFGLALSTAGFTTTLRWLPVLRYEDGGAFMDPLAPVPDELLGYRVFRATSPTLATWAEQAVIATTATVTWTDLAGGPQYYYHVKAENTSGLSDASVVRAAGSESAWIVAPDDQSSLEILSNSVQPVEGQEGDPMSAYLVDASSAPQELGGRVLRSVDFGAWQGGVLPAGNLALPGMGILRMHYDLGASGSVTAAGFDTVAATPQNMSVYWWNGTRWVQLYGDLDAQAQMMIISTKYLGRYQLRSVERPQAFNFNQAGVSNRLVTPNGDGKNDAVVFTYDNPRDSAVTVRILDIKGKVVAGSLPEGPVSNSKVWAPGAAVPGGVYIYQIESEGQVFTGTVVILK